MSRAFQAPKNARGRLNDWFRVTPGRLVLEAELEQLNQVLPNLFGYHLVQVGVWGNLDMLGASRILNRVVVAVNGDVVSGNYPNSYGSATALPIASDTVDVAILPHVLELEARPHEALREAERILVPEGHVLIAGFNPWSMMGLWRFALRRRHSLPWAGQFFGLNRIRDWLALLGFDTVSTHTYFFRPPFGNERLMERLHAVELSGRRGWPYLAGAYLIVAKKRVTTLTPVKPRWGARRRLVSVGLAGPSARVTKGE